MDSHRIVLDNDWKLVRRDNITEGIIFKTRDLVDIRECDCCFKLIYTFKIDNEYTYSSSVPFGTSSEIIKFNALIRCYKNLIDPNSSEYMSWMLNRPDVFKVEDVFFSGRLLKFKDIIFTVDEKNEYLITVGVLTEGETGKYKLTHRKI